MLVLVAFLFAMCSCLMCCATQLVGFDGALTVDLQHAELTAGTINQDVCVPAYPATLHMTLSFGKQACVHAAEGGLLPAFTPALSSGSAMVNQAMVNQAPCVRTPELGHVRLCMTEHLAVTVPVSMT